MSDVRNAIREKRAVQKAVIELVGVVFSKLVVMPAGRQPNGSFEERGKQGSAWAIRVGGVRRHGLLIVSGGKLVNSE
jgi:hypothetical protein